MEKTIKRKPSFPVVFKGHGEVWIIYKDRVERYSHKNTDTKTQIDKENSDCCYDYEDIFGKGWNAYHEVEMLKNNKFKRVHDSKSDTWSD